MASAIRYSDRNPKYIELYSRNPPSIAPSRFENMATATDLLLPSSAEKANPEKSRGSVSTAVAIARASQGVKRPKLAEDRNNQAISEANSKP